MIYNCMLHITAGAIEITDRLVLITVNVIRIIAAALSSGVVAALMTSEAILLAAGRACYDNFHCLSCNFPRNTN